MVQADSITIRNGWGTEIYTAKVALRVGPFAIHNENGYKRRWNVTHEPSNYTACHFIRRKGDAIAFAKWLVEQFEKHAVNVWSSSHEELGEHERWEELRLKVVEHRNSITDYYKPLASTQSR